MFIHVLNLHEVSDRQCYVLQAQWYTNKTVKYHSNQPDIHLVVTATDNGTPQLSAMVAIRVQVIDINNNAPVFTEEEYK